MNEDQGASERSMRRGAKAKTGCATCRARKVKCDETKPRCRRCVDTGRTCDGYASPFRYVTHRQPVVAPSTGLPPAPTATEPEVRPQDIELLSRYFSTKTLFDVPLRCEDEARQVLQASRTDPLVRQAVSSLRALRQDLETSRRAPARWTAQPTPGSDFGLRQYGRALGGLASSLSAPGAGGLRSALLCCQVFVSIEQAQGRHAAVARHIVQGLGILRAYRARPALDAARRLVPARPDPLPLLDVFVIKMFAAPCPFTDPPSTGASANGAHGAHGANGANSANGSYGAQQPIAPDARPELERIAAATLAFLGRVSAVRSAEEAVRLLPRRASLLDALAAWLRVLGRAYADVGSPGSEPLSASFLLCFHQVLQLVLLGTLDASPRLGPQLQSENERLLALAGRVTERVKAYTRAQVHVHGRV